MIFFTFLMHVHASDDCNQDCPSSWLGDHFCDSSCMTGPCGYDLEDCKYYCLMSNCPNETSDGICDEACNISQCGYDYGDCFYCDEFCTEELYYNNVCDSECNSIICNYDNYSCGYCSSGCFENMLGNGVCDPSCLTSKCDFDFLDNEYCNFTKIYVTSENATDGDGSLLYPINNLIYAFYTMAAMYTEILLVGSENFILYNEDFIGFCHITENIAYVIIRPLYCSEENVFGCYEEGYMPIILGSREPLCLGISNRLLIKNVIFSQHELFDPYCQECDYCRYSFTDLDGVTTDDRGEILHEDQYVDSEICDDYSIYWLFKVNTNAYFYLENVRFENMRLGMESLIKISDGFLSMTNVNFTNIVTTGKVINAPKLFDRLRFSYSGGVVSFINNGYEIIDANPLNSFIYLEYFTEVTIENVIFQYNLCSSSALGFVTIVDSLVVKLSNLQFINNYSKDYLVYIDQSTVEIYLNPINSTDYIDNVLIHNCRFENNTASKLVYVYYISECQNIQIGQNYFENNAVEENVVLIEYGEVLPILCIDGNTATGGGTPRRYIMVSSSEFLNNFSGSGMVTIKNLANIQISDLSINENGLNTDINEATFISLINQPGAYISKPLSNFIGITNYFLISLINNYRVSLENNNFLRNQSPLIVIDNSMTELIFKHSRFQDNLLNSDEWFLSISSQVFLQLEYLEFYNATYQNQAKGLIYLKATSSNSEYSILNVHIENSSDAIRAQMLSSLLINNLTIIGSTAKLFSGLYFTGTATSSLSIFNSFFIFNSGTVFYLTSEISGSSLLLSLIESEFYELKSPGVFVDSSLVLHSDSVISNVNFVENKGLVLNIASSSGKIVLEMCDFDGNLAKSTSVIKITGANEVLIDESVFQYNKAENLVYVYSEDNSTFASIQNSRFHYNQGTAVKASYAVFYIKNSKFIGNQGKFGTVGYLTTAATGGFYNVEIENNSASGNGMIYMIIGSYAKLNNIAFYNNSVLGKGAGIFADQNSSVAIEGSRFEENSAFQGSSLFIQHCLSKSSVKSSIFIKNKAQTSGAITILESYLVIENSTIDGNTADHYPAIECLYYSNIDIYGVIFKSHIGIGGNLGVETSLATVKNSSFFNASSYYDASVFYVVSSSILCEGCVIENATSLVESAIYCEKSECNFNENIMRNINVGIKGSVIFGDDMSNIIVENTVISNYKGSGITISRTSYLTFINSTLQNGSSFIGGGIFCTECTSAQISSSIFSNLSSSTYGGCLYLNPLNPPNTLSISSSLFSSCSSSLGGAIFLKSQSTLISTSTFLSNKALLSDLENSGQGGSIFIADSSSTQQTSITNCSFSNSSATTSGGGIQWYGAYPTIKNCLFSENQAFYGPNISSYPSQLKISQNRLLNTLEIAPGQQISYPIIINILDHYNQTVLTESSGTGQISVTNTLNYSLSGEAKVTAKEGILNFSNILLTGHPKTFTSLSVTGSFSSTLQLIQEDLNIFVRECVIGESLVNDNSCIVCQAGKYNLKAGDNCKQCPQGALCYGSKDIVADAGYWRYSKSTDVIMECPFTDACLEEKIDFENSKCLEGYTGNLCQSCEKGYSRSGENQCTRCLERSRNIAMLLGIIILLIIIIIILTASNIKAALKDQSLTSVYYKIIINYFQIVLLTISFNLDWPWLVKNMFTFQSQTAGTSDQLFSFDCYLAENMEPFYAKIIILSILPIISGIFSSIFWLSWSLFHTTLNLKEKIIGSITVQLFIFQPSLLKFNFAVFNCMEITPGSYFLISDLNIQCWDSKHLKYALGAALPSLVVWCILAPIALLIFLTKHRNELNMKEERFKYGFIYKGFKTERFFWEFVTMARKLLIISAAVFFKNISVNVQALATFLIIIIAYSLQSKLEPYAVEQLNSMEKKSIIVSAVTIYCGLFFLTKDIDEGGKNFMFAIMLLSNLVFLSYWAYYTFGFFIKKMYLRFGFLQKCVKWLIRRKNIEVVPQMNVYSEDEQNRSLVSQWANNSQVHIVNEINSPENSIFERV